MSRARCDVCHDLAPDVVQPILIGINGWRIFELDGEIDGMRWEGLVLACPRDRANVEAGRASIRTFHGGRDTEPTWKPEHVEVPTR